MASTSACHIRQMSAICAASSSCIRRTVPPSWPPSTPGSPKGPRCGTYDRASALALVDLANGAPGAGQRPIVVIDGDVAELSSGGVVGAETAELLACDATIQSGGKTVAAIPAATRRKVEARDGGRCTFPGCEKGIFIHCHHRVRRADGGSNDASNLQLVCWHHHGLIHEHGWTIRGPAGHGCTWVRPDGTPFEPRIRGRPDG